MRHLSPLLSPFTDLSWIALAFLAALSAAGVALFGKLAMQSSDTASATLARSIIMSGVLLLYVVLRGKGFSPVADGGSWAWLWIGLAGVCGALSWLAYFAALRHGPVTGVAVIDRGSVVLAVLLAFTFLGERPGTQAWLGLVIVTIGLVLVATSPPSPTPPTRPPAKHVDR